MKLVMYEIVQLCTIFKGVIDYLEKWKENIFKEKKNRKKRKRGLEVNCNILLLSKNFQ